MFSVIFWSLCATVVAGLIVKRILEVRRSDARITRRELYVGFAIAPIIAILVVWLGWGIARNNLLTFTEYWNGWEVGAVKTEIPCSKNGPCNREYSCEPYPCNPHPCGCVCSGYDSNGRCTGETCQTCYDTCYNSCPYVTSEYTYTVSSTLGPVEIAGYVFPDNPEEHRWRGTSDYASRIPSNVIASAGTGEPSFWVAVRNRCESKAPGPVTARKNYTNYVLASDHTLMREHSLDVAEYKAQKLLPPVAKSVQAFYHADKVSFIGWQPKNRLAWQESLEYFNGNFGQLLHGDLHLVIAMDARIASNPERYVIAIKAYWQDKSSFQSDALSKNATVVVVGTVDGETVAWSRAFTGMPLGNEALIVAMRDGLKGQQLTPENLIGPARSRSDGRAVSYPPDGNLTLMSRILWGVDNPATKFKRVSMSGDDGQVGFLYLKNEIQPTSGQMWVMFFVSFILSSLVWVWAAIHFDQSEYRGSYSRPYRR